VIVVCVVSSKWYKKSYELSCYCTHTSSLSHRAPTICVEAPVVVIVGSLRRDTVIVIVRDTIV